MSKTKRSFQKDILLNSFRNCSVILAQIVLRQWKARLKFEMFLLSFRKKITFELVCRSKESQVSKRYRTGQLSPISLYSICSCIQAPDSFPCCPYTSALTYHIFCNFPSFQSPVLLPLKSIRNSQSFQRERQDVISGQFLSLS